MPQVIHALELALGVVVAAIVAWFAWGFAWSGRQRPWKLKRSLRSIARCTLRGPISLRDLADLVGEAVARVDGGISGRRAVYRQPACSLLLLEDGRPRPFVLVLHRADRKAAKDPKRTIDAELCSGFSMPPAPGMKPSRRVLEAVDRALRALPTVESVRWTRDRSAWFDRPFDP